MLQKTEPSSKKLLESVLIALISAFLTIAAEGPIRMPSMRQILLFGFLLLVSALVLRLSRSVFEEAGNSKRRTVLCAVAALVLTGLSDPFLPSPLPLRILGTPQSYSALEMLLYSFGLLLALFFCLCFAACWLDVKRGNLGRTIRKSIGKIALFCLYLANAYLLFETSSVIVPTRGTKMVLLVLTVAAACCALCDKARPVMKKYRNGSGTVAILLISVYASFASFAQRFFLNGNTRVHFSAAGTVYCISGVLWFFTVIGLLLYLMERAPSHVRIRRPLRERTRAFLLLFGVLASCQMAVLAILWPGGFPTDAITQLYQAVGIDGLNDWHPVLDTLFVRLIMAAFHSPGMLAAVQMLLFALLCTLFLMIGYDRGISLGRLCLFGGLFQLLPNQALSWSNVLKDFPFTLALLWGSYLLLLLAMESKWCRKPSFAVCLGLDMFLIAGLRHNGIVPFGLMALLCVVLTVRRFSLVRFRALFATVLAVVCFAVYRGPVFQMLNVAPNTMSSYTTMLCGVASCVNKDLPLSDKTDAALETVISLSDWKQYYDRYQGHDQYQWGRTDGEPFDTSRIDAKTAFSMYFEALGKYPDVVIKDRIDGMDIMWDVVQPADSFNARSFNLIHAYADVGRYFDVSNMEPDEWGEYRKTETLARWYHSTTQTDISGVLDIVLWRSGCYLIMFWTMLLFWRKNGMRRLLWASVPMLGNIAGCVLVLYHQSFRYVYFIQVVTVALLFATLALKRSWREAADQPDEGTGA